MSLGDPFNESVRELRDLTVRAKLIQYSITQKSFVDPASLGELEEICADMSELATLLTEMQRVVEDKGGKVHGKIFSANEIMGRQNTLRALASEVSEASGFLRQVRARSEARNLASASAATSAHSRESGGGPPDGFLVAQEYAQREETKQQDEVIDRLTYGLQELRETGININDELEQQDEMLTEVERDMTGVQVRLRAANAKVDKLLASMSNKGKICTIVVLICVLIFLAFFAIG